MTSPQSDPLPPSEPPPLVWKCRECDVEFDPYWHGDMRPHCSIECARTERRRTLAAWRAEFPYRPPTPPPKPPQPARPRRPRPSHDPSRNAAIVRALQAGRSVSDVAREYELSRQRIYQIHARAISDANRNPPTPRPSPHYHPHPRFPRAIEELFDWHPAYVAGVLDAIATRPPINR